MSGLPAIESVGFWLGGVVAPSLPALCARVALGKPLEKLDIQVRLALREAANDLTLGRLSPAEFCGKAASIVGISNAAALETALINGLRLQADVLNIIDELASETTCWLICDYPRRWFEAAVSDDVLKHIPAERVMFTAESDLANLIPDLFDEWTKRAGQPFGKAMLVDQTTPHMTEAVRHGLHAAIFVDARRLRREFVLRRMLPPPPGFSYPGSALPITRTPK